MVNRELQLIAKIVQTGDLRTVIKNRISSNMLVTPEARAAFRYLWEYYHHPKHQGCIPKRGFFYERFPSFPKNIPIKDVSIPELCERVRELAMSREIRELANSVSELALDTPYKALEALRDSTTRIQAMTASSNSVLLADMADELISEYDTVNRHGGMTGIPFPWKELNRATGGMHEEDFILMYADHKTLKSFLGLFMACFVYKKAHRRVLYYASEMNRLLIARRAATAFCRLSYEEVKAGKLNPGQAEMFKGMVQELGCWEEDSKKEGRRPQFYIVKDDGGPAAKSGIHQLMAEIEAFEPDVVFADSFYRMVDDYDWKVQSNLTKTLKSTAERYKIPIVGISQRNRDQSRGRADRGMGDIGYSLAGAQETDLGFRLVYDGENEDGTVVLHFVIAAAREIKHKGFTIHFSPYTTARWVRWLNEGDLDELNQRQKDRSKKRKDVEESGQVHREEKEALAALAHYETFLKKPKSKE